MEKSEVLMRYRKLVACLAAGLTHNTDSTLSAMGKKFIADLSEATDFKGNQADSNLGPLFEHAQNFLISPPNPALVRRFCEITRTLADQSAWRSSGPTPFLQNRIESLAEETGCQSTDPVAVIAHVEKMIFPGIT